MKTLYLISGDLAAGKSTLAENLSNELKVPCLIKDDMKALCCDIIGFKNREENKQNSIASVALMIYTFNQLAKQGQDIILEANFREDELAKIQEIVDKYDYSVKKIMLYGDTKELYKRFLERLPYRHEAHKTMHLEESFEKYENVLLEFRKYCKDDFIKIDSTKLNEQETLQAVLKQIR